MKSSRRRKITGFSDCMSGSVPDLRPEGRRAHSRTRSVAPPRRSTAESMIGETSVSRSIARRRLGRIALLGRISCGRIHDYRTSGPEKALPATTFPAKFSYGTNIFADLLLPRRDYILGEDVKRILHPSEGDRETGTRFGTSMHPRYVGWKGDERRFVHRRIGHER